MRFCLLTVVWGPEFTDRFIRITLRSLLAPGNLGDLAANQSVVYDIHTTDVDAERLRAHPVFQQVSRLAEVRLHVFPVAQIDPRNPSSHWILWHRGAAQLTAADDVLVTVAADHLFSRGALVHWAGLFLSGSVAMFGSGVQVVAETLEEEIERLFPAGPAIDLSVESLHELMFRHLHPVKISMLRGSPRWIEHPEEHLRPLPGYGFSQNVLTSHAVAFRPRAVRMNDNFCPVEKLDQVAFEPCRYLSLEPVLKHVSLYLHPWQMTDKRLSNFGEWGANFIFPVNKRESRKTHFYRAPGSTATVERPLVANAARSFVRQLHTSQHVFEMWRCLRARGQYAAARWLAAAQMHGRLRRRLAIRLPATVFVPAEAVFARMSAGQQEKLLAGGGRQLITATRAHVAEGHHRLEQGDWLAPSPAGTIRAGDGSAYTAASSGTARIIAGPVHLDGVDLYTIDRPLVPLDLMPAGALNSAKAIAGSLRHRARRATASLKAVLVHQLQRNPRHYHLARQLRAALDRRLRRGAAPANEALARAAEPAMAAYRRGLGWRIADAMRELYAFYSTSVLAGTTATSAPAERLARNAPAGGRAPLELADAARLAPDFAEAWLELGFAHLQAGDRVQALDAFAKARSASPMLARTRLDPDPRTVAALERVRLLVDDIDPEEALALLDSGPLIRPIPWAVHELRSRLLLQTGRIDEALAAFDSCMSRDNIQESFGRMLPRNLLALESSVSEAPAARTH